MENTGWNYSVQHAKKRPLGPVVRGACASMCSLLCAFVSNGGGTPQQLLGQKLSVKCETKDAGVSRAQDTGLAANQVRCPSRSRSDIRRGPCKSWENIAIHIGCYYT